MKERLLERLKMMDKAIVDQHQKVQQAGADLNMLNGCRQELVHIINVCEQDEMAANEDEAKLVEAESAVSPDVACEVV